MTRKIIKIMLLLTAGFMAYRLATQGHSIEIIIFAIVNGVYYLIGDGKGKDNGK